MGLNNDANLHLLSLPVQHGDRIKSIVFAPVQLLQAKEGTTSVGGGPQVK